MLPWTKRDFAGFPTAEHVVASCVSQVVEDLPQLIIQVLAARANGCNTSASEAPQRQQLKVSMSIGMPPRIHLLVAQAYRARVCA